jgi:hypothetical protein
MKHRPLLYCQRLSCRLHRQALLLTWKLVCNGADIGGHSRAFTASTVKKGRHKIVKPLAATHLSETRTSSTRGRYFRVWSGQNVTATDEIPVKGSLRRLRCLPWTGSWMPSGCVSQNAVPHHLTGIYPLEPVAVSIHPFPSQSKQMIA